MAYILAAPECIRGFSDLEKDKVNEAVNGAWGRGNVLPEEWHVGHVIWHII